MSNQLQPSRKTFDRDGFYMLRGGCGPVLLERLQDAVGQVEGAGQRHFDKAGVPIEEVLQEPLIKQNLERFIGAGFFSVRTILFDKTADANWGVPPHRDTTICVQERADVPGFGPWSVKAGVPHVQPPDEVLNSMVTIRVHLDNATRETGGLSVWPASHLEDDQAWNRDDSILCEAMAGDVLFMRPRLVHASSKMTMPSRRRVVHIELANSELPRPLEWRRQSRNK